MTVYEAPGFQKMRENPDDEDDGFIWLSCWRPYIRCDLPDMDDFYDKLVKKQRQEYVSTHWLDIIFESANDSPLDVMEHRFMICSDWQHPRIGPCKKFPGYWCNSGFLCESRYNPRHKLYFPMPVHHSDRIIDTSYVFIELLYPELRNLEERINLNERNEANIRRHAIFNFLLHF